MTATIASVGPSGDCEARNHASSPINAPTNGYQAAAAPGGTFGADTGRIVKNWSAARKIYFTLNGIPKAIQYTSLAAAATR